MNEAPPAGFWLRALAALVDGAVFVLVQISLGYLGVAVDGPDGEGLALVGPFTLLFSLAYTTLLHSLVDGQTIGKMLTGIRVVAVDGRGVPIGVAVLRYAGYFVSLVPLGLGFLMAGLRSDKRALHDLIAGTRVERVVVAAVPSAVPPAEPVP